MRPLDAVAYDTWRTAGPPDEKMIHCYRCGEIMCDNDAQPINGEPHCPVCFDDMGGVASGEC